MFEALDTVSWTVACQPEWNTTDEIPNSLRQLASCDPKSGWVKPYRRFLYAVGNDHAGTYYPAVLSTIPFLGEILKNGSETAQIGTLNALIDLIGTFYPEPGCEKINNPNGEQPEVRLQLVLEARRLYPLIHEIAVDSSKESETRQFADDLLKILATSEGEGSG